MKFRLILAAGLLALSGCATYDYTGAGSGGYYRGAPAVQYRYPPGYAPYSYGALTEPAGSVCTTIRCTRSIAAAAAIITASTIDVRSTVPTTTMVPGRMARARMVGPTVRARSAPTRRQPPARHRVRRSRRVSALRRG